jgi:hypothetical protein
MQGPSYGTANSGTGGGRGDAQAGRFNPIDDLMLGMIGGVTTRGSPSTTCRSAQQTPPGLNSPASTSCRHLDRGVL